MRVDLSVISIYIHMVSMRQYRRDLILMRAHNNSSFDQIRKKQKQRPKKGKKTKNSVRQIKTEIFQNKIVDSEIKKQ